MKIYSVYDSKVSAYLQPFFCPSRGQAMRSFVDVVNDKSHQFNKHYLDYVLFECGSWSDEDCKFVLHATPDPVITGIEAYMPSSLVD